MSVRVPGRGLFAITPSNYDYAKMQADDICVLDYDLHRVTGTMKASIEAGMHAAVYQQRPDVNVIIHTHQPYASALALMNKPIPALFDEQVCFLGRGVEIVRYGPSGTIVSEEPRQGEAEKRRQRLHPGQPRRARAGRRRRARHAQHGPAREGGARLPAHAAAGEKAATIPLPIREIAFAKLRADEKKLAAQEAEAAARGGGRPTHAAPAEGDTTPTGRAAAAASAAPDRSGRAPQAPRPAVPAPPPRRPPAGATAPPADQQRYAISSIPTSRPSTPASSSS